MSFDLDFKKQYDDVLFHVDLNEYEATEILKHFTGNDMIQSTVKFIRNRLLSRGIRVTGKNEMDPQVVSGIDYVINKYWSIFAEEALNAYLCFGYVPYIIRKISISEVPNAKEYKLGRKNDFILVPVVLDYGTYMARYLITKQGEKKIEITLKESTPREKKIPAFAITVAVPDITNGNHNSHMSGLLDHLRWMDILMKTTIKGEVGRTEPVVIVQTRSDDTKTEVNPNTALAYGDDDMAEQADAQKYHRHVNKMDELFMMRGMSTKLNETARGNVDINPRTREVIEFSSMVSSNMLVLGESHEIGNQPPKPEPRSDLANLIKDSATRISSSFGIPKSLILNESSARSNNSDIDLKVQTDTMSDYRKILLKTLEEVFYHIHSNNNVHIELVEGTYIATESILLNYKMGVIDTDNFINLMGTTTGVPLRQINKQGNPYKSMEKFTIAENGGPKEQAGASSSAPKKKKKSSSSSSEKSSKKIEKSTSSPSTNTSGSNPAAAKKRKTN